MKYPITIEDLNKAQRRYDEALVGVFIAAALIAAFTIAVCVTSLYIAKKVDGFNNEVARSFVVSSH